jgi:hypothetical protein
VASVLALNRYTFGPNGQSFRTGVVARQSETSWAPWLMWLASVTPRWTAYEKEDVSGHDPRSSAGDVDVSERNSGGAGVQRYVGHRHRRHYDRERPEGLNLHPTAVTSSLGGLGAYG